MSEHLSIKDRTAVVGIGQTAFGKGPGGHRALARVPGHQRGDRRRGPPAVRRRRPRDVLDGGRAARSTSPATSGSATSPSSPRSGTAAAPAAGVVGQAAMAVATGQCQVAVAWRARKRAAKASRPWAQVSDRLAGHQQWSRPFGLLRPVDEIAILTRRAMHEYGYTRDHLANVALAFPQARGAQPERDDGPQAADPRAVHGRALDLRAAVPLRQLPRDRRRARGRDHERRTRPRPAPAARSSSTRSRRASRSSTR